LAATCAGQVMQQPGTLPGRGTAQRPAQDAGHAPEHPAAGTKGAAPAEPTPGNSAGNGPALPPSLLDKPAQPAQITLSDGVLAIRADNSSLSQILRHLSSSSGMTVDGFQKDQRVFGVYGPGNPRDVLSGLLQDAGYNFLLVGATEKGTPREIVLTASTGGGATSGPAQAQPDDQQPDEEDNDNSSNSSFPPEPVVPDRAAPPGAETSPPNPNGQVKSPAEIIQELQRLRQQQQNPQ
jgi:hypothetical protein